MSGSTRPTDRETFTVTLEPERQFDLGLGLLALRHYLVELTELLPPAEQEGRAALQGTWHAFNELAAEFAPELVFARDAVKHH